MSSWSSNIDWADTVDGELLVLEKVELFQRANLALELKIEEEEAKLRQIHAGGDKKSSDH